MSPSTIGRQCSYDLRHSAAASVEWDEGLPDSIKRVGEVSAFPNEGPGMVYEFNWALNGDGVTPLKRNAFRINKSLDLKVAGLNAPKTNPLKVDGTAIPEAGSESLSFEKFDEACQVVRDNLSLADALYCPEGHVPGTHTGVRVITNSGASIASDLVAYLDRCPKTSPLSMPITCFVYEGSDEPFAGFSIEEIEVAVAPPADGAAAMEAVNVPKEAKSVATVVVSSKQPDLKSIIGGIEASQQALEQDEKEREASKQDEEE
uniref:Uncharacterized protein n=1 Tax=Craspedostauros australis TaxID=1486917 RepID=A0A7R9ZNZ2_9STRA|mmetsp:Transcript_24183/g.67412  ORF Transcript_24183/g.67412 Transcript_24183/m.67412 type:complete len:261 (+) Transcript_24183:122-904(+)